MIPTTLGIKAPVWVRTSMDWPPSGSFWFRLLPLGLRLPLLAASGTGLPPTPLGSSPSGQQVPGGVVLAWPPSPDFLPLHTLQYCLPGSPHSPLLLVFLPTKSTHLSDLFTKICLACSKHSINIHQMNERICQPYTYLTHVPTCEGTIFNSGSWWWTGRPGVLRFTGSQRVGHD